MFFLLRSITIYVKRLFVSSIGMVLGDKSKIRHMSYVMLI